MFVQQYVAFLDNFCQFESFYDLDFFTFGALLF